MNRVLLRTESVLSIHRGGIGDIPTLAATYAIEIVRDRPMIDRNLRLAFAVFGTFLELCDFGLNADRGDVLKTLLKLRARDYAVRRTYRGNLRLLNFGGPFRFTNE